MSKGQKRGKGGAGGGQVINSGGGLFTQEIRGTDGKVSGHIITVDFNRIDTPNLTYHAEYGFLDSIPGTAKFVFVSLAPNAFSSDEPQLESYVSVSVSEAMFAKFCVAHRKLYQKAENAVSSRYGQALPEIPHLAASASTKRQGFAATMCSTVLITGEASMDFFYLSPADARKLEQRAGRPEIQPIIRIALSDVALRELLRQCYKVYDTLPKNIRELIETEFTQDETQE